MKSRASIFTFSFLFIGLGLVVCLALTTVRENTSMWRLVLLGVVAVLVIWAVAALFNLAVFLPVYWVIGKLSKKKEKSSDGDA